MPTIRDVARLAGVSIATVSAAINGADGVKEATRKRVLAAVERVGYAPNALARSLRLGRSRLVGAIVGDIANPFLAAMVRTIEAAASDRGYSVIVCNTDDNPARELAMVDHMRAQGVAGILLNPIGAGPAYVRHLRRSGAVPIVTLDQKVAGLERDFVGVDNRAASRMLTAYLLRMGHRRIGMIHAKPGLWTSDERLSAFVETLIEAGIKPDPTLLLSGNYNGTLAYRAASSMLTGARPPSAILAANNVMALGALQAILDLGFRCPDDVSLVGIDDVPWSALVRPRITNASQPIGEIAKLAADWLFERIAGKGPPPRERVFQPNLVLGDSVAAVRPARAVR